MADPGMVSLRQAVSVRQLRAFVAVYHSASISAAADALALTQPAVTVLIKDMEDRLGVRLFDRTSRSMRRTEAAEKAFLHAQRVLGELKALNENMAALASGRDGHIRIAATSTVAQTVLPPIIRQFLNVRPTVRVAVNDCAPSEFAESLLREQADIGVGTLEGDVPGLIQRVVLEDPLCAVASRDEFRDAGEISWDELSAYPIIAVRGGYGIRRSIDVAAMTAGVELHVEYEVSLLTTALSMAASGLGVALVPKSVLDTAQFASLAGRRLTSPEVSRALAIVYCEGRSMSPAAQAFADVLRDCMSRSGQSSGPPQA